VSRQQRIDELTKKLSELREQRDSIDAEANEFAERRNALNERVKGLQAEILGLRNERDELNVSVKELKQRRSEAKEKIHDMVEEAEKLSQEIRVLNEKRPSRGFESLQSEVEEIDWKIQTMSPSVKEEKALVEQVKQLESQLSIYRKIQQLSHRLQSKRAEITAVKNASEGYHMKLTEHAEKSQQLHEKMLTRIEESKKIRSEANGLHKQFLDEKERTRPAQEAIDGISEEIRLLKGELRAEEEMKKKQREDAFREKVENEAREKLKRGEKLTWEEFQLLAEKDETAQD
jgi:uncharacterized coiled-coil DUF342 family protein